MGNNRVRSPCDYRGVNLSYRCRLAKQLMVITTNNRLPQICHSATLFPTPFPTLAFTTISEGSEPSWSGLRKTVIIRWACTPTCRTAGPSIRVEPRTPRAPRRRQGDNAGTRQKESLQLVSYCHPRSRPRGAELLRADRRVRGYSQRIRGFVTASYRIKSASGRVADRLEE